MNLRRTLLTFLMLAIASVASAQGVKIVKNTINKDSLPSDAIVVKRVPLESGPAFEAKDVLVVDTIPSSSEGLNIVLYNDNTWRFVRNRDIDVLDETVFTKEWDTTKIQPFKVELKDLPMSMVIDLVDSLKSYHYPFKGRVTSKYGPRRRRIHQGTDIDLETGDPVYATFDGRARRSEYWYWVLFNTLVGLFLGWIPVLGWIICVLFILPSLSVCIRRLHDIGKSGWWYLLVLIPLVNLVLIYFFILDSQPGVNQYGPNPKGIGNQEMIER